MSDKRTQKILKRKKKKILNSVKSVKAKEKQLEKMVGRLNNKIKTSKSDLLQTMHSPDIPESEWHPDDKKKILEGNEHSEKNSGKKSCEKRRPDGSYTIMEKIRD